MHLRRIAGEHGDVVDKMLDAVVRTLLDYLDAEASYRLPLADIAAQSGARTGACLQSTSVGASSNFIRISLSAVGGPNPSWERPVQAYFRRDGGGWRLVGFERLPEG